MAHMIAVYLGCQARLNYFLKVVFPEVLFQSAPTFEGQRWVAFPGAKGHYFARFFLPLIDNSWICRDLNCSPVLLEAHSATESLIIQRTDGLLESVIISRSQDSTRQSTSRNRSKVSFDWFFLDHFSSIKLIALFAKCDPFQRNAFQCNCSIVVQLIQHLAVIQGTQPQTMALRALQKHPCQSEKRISSMSLLDLLNNFGEGALFRQEVHLNGGRLDLFRRSGSRLIATRSVSIFNSRRPLAR